MGNANLVFHSLLVLSVVFLCIKQNSSESKLFLIVTKFSSDILLLAIQGLTLTLH
jgi:hypothetical protein